MSARKPLVEWGIRVIEYSVPSLEPVEFGGYARPEFLEIGDGVLVDLLVGFHRYECPLVLWDDLLVERESPVYGHRLEEGDSF